LFKLLVKIGEWLNLERYEIEKERAKQRQLAGVSIKSQETFGSSEPEVGRARDVVSFHAGVSQAVKEAYEKHRKKPFWKIA